jgi:folate-binding protein YgfZ
VPDRYPLHDLHAAAGARFVAPCGIDLPIDYGDPAAEYASVRRAAGLIDRGPLGLLEVTGKDRAAFLHAMLSNDVKSLAPGQGCAAAFLDVHGKVQVMLRLLVLEDRILVVTPSGMAADAMEALDKFLFSEKAYFRDATGELTFLLLAGPEAPALAERLTGQRPPEPAWSHVAARLGEDEVRLVSGGGETGEPEVWILAAAGERAWAAVRAAGVVPVGVTAQEALRIETGTPLYHHDVDASVLLPEIPLDPLVSYTKGCYIGQEVVVRIRDRGHVNRHLRGLVLEGDQRPAPGAAVMADGAEVGRLTSTTWSFGLGRPIALGFVRRQHAEPGTRVAVRDGERLLPATVSALPFSR